MRAIVALGLLAASPPAVGPTIEDRTVFPESITSTKDGMLVSGGTANGALYRGSVRDGVMKRWTQPVPGTAIFGVLADEKRKALWACHVVQPAGKAATALAEYDLTTGALRKSYPFPANGLCNDIAVAPDGTVYATDITNGQVLRLGKDGRVAIWSVGAPIAGVDGIVVHRGRTVVVNSIASGKLLALDIGRDGTAGAAREIALSRPLERPDGMRLASADRLLIVESSGKLASVTLKGSGRAGDGRKSDAGRVDTLAEGMDGPVAVTPHGGTAYVVQGHLRYLFTPALRGQDPGPHGVYAIKLPR